MPRNGSGTASIPNSFTPSTTISSAAVNGNFSDIADMLTGSVAADGQTTITAPLKGANGSASAPAYGFASDGNTGMYRKGADQLGFATGGTERAYFDTNGFLVLAVGAKVGSDTVDKFPSGTRMPFQQTTPPSGWTKDTATSGLNNSAMRIVTGTVGSGGSSDFTTAFASRTIVASNLPVTSPWSINDPGHTHTYDQPINTNSPTGSGATRIESSNPGTATGSSTTGITLNTNSGGGQAMNFAVRYFDFCIGVKD